MPELRELTSAEQRWKDLSTETMEAEADTVAVVVMIVDRRGVIRSLVSTKNLPEAVGATLRGTITEVMAQLCRMLFSKPFRCGCRTCESEEGKAMRNMQGHWSPTKAQA
jgi:hypothetical protein